MKTKISKLAKVAGPVLFCAAIIFFAGKWESGLVTKKAAAEAYMLSSEIKSKYLPIKSHEISETLVESRFNNIEDKIDSLHTDVRQLLFERRIALKGRKIPPRKQEPPDKYATTQESYP